MGEFFNRVPHHFGLGSYYDNAACAERKIPKADKVFLMVQWDYGICCFCYIWFNE